MEFCTECTIDEVRSKLREREAMLRVVDDRLESLAYTPPESQADAVTIIRRLICDELGR